MKDLKSLKRIKEIKDESPEASKEAFSNFFSRIKQSNLKIAQEEAKIATPTNSAIKTLSVLRANLIASQNAHWMSKGDNFYGDHLMYERIYNENLEELDKFAEKMIPMIGEKVISPVESLSISLEVLKSHADIKPESSPKEVLNMALEIEKVTLTSVEQLYKEMSESKEMTLGLDDLLMNICNSHEGHIYLLSQRIK